MINHLGNPLNQTEKVVNPSHRFIPTNQTPLRVVASQPFLVAARYVFLLVAATLY
jgi:hypothetical protein